LALSISGLEPEDNDRLPSFSLTDVYQELGGNDHPDEVDKYMVKNIGEGHLLPEMKDCITKVQNLVTETNGAAWATAFAEVSTLLSLFVFIPLVRVCVAVAVAATATAVAI
jgi:hypothetical protein